MLGIEPHIVDKLFEHAHKRKCLDCKGEEAFEMDLFGEISCFGCSKTGKGVKLVDAFAVKKIKQSAE